MNAVIIDDEQNNIDNVCYLLKQYCTSVHVIGTACSADEGKEILQKENIDILFLDIQMPGKNGFELLTELASYNFQVIFVTAYDTYAVKAIKFSALDYLLKPIEVDELIAAVKKAEANYTKNYSEKQIKNLLVHLNEVSNSNSNIALPLAHELRFVKLSDIIYCQSENNYTLFFLINGEKVIVSKGLYEFESLLPENNFIRCHQSYIVNKKFIKSLHREGLLYYLETTSNQTVPVSRSKKDFVKAKLIQK